MSTVINTQGKFPTHSDSFCSGLGSQIIFSQASPTKASTTPPRRRKAELIIATLTGQTSFSSFCIRGKKKRKKRNTQNGVFVSIYCSHFVPLMPLASHQWKFQRLAAWWSRQEMPFSAFFSRSWYCNAREGKKNNWGVSSSVQLCKRAFPSAVCSWW